MPASPFLPRMIGAAASLCLAFNAAACGSAEPSGGEAVDAAACERVAEISPAAAAPAVALVVDNTASATVSKLSPAVREHLTTAQKEGAKLLLIGVDGSGRAATVTRTVALDPAPGSKSRAAEKLRGLAIGCVDHWAHDKPMRPGAPGSAIVDAIGVAARQSPSVILVASDGADTVNLAIDQSKLDAAPQDLARRFVETGSLPAELAGKKVLWTGMGETATPLPQRSRNRLTELWATLLRFGGAEVEFRTELGERGAPVEGLPADEVLMDHVVASSIACGTIQTIPAGLLFGGDEIDLRSDAREMLGPIAATLSGAGGAAALVEGHTAAYGPESERIPFSQLRAQVVADELVRLGADRSRIEVRGQGSARPRVDEFPGGVHSEAAAAHNRRVEITIGSGGCGK